MEDTAAYSPRMHQRQPNVALDQFFGGHGAPRYGCTYTTVEWPCVRNLQYTQAPRNMHGMNSTSGLHEIMDFAHLAQHAAYRRPASYLDPLKKGSKVLEAILHLQPH